ncbi:MAG: hypothetical protein JRN54_08015 [Nitrososphaerota archaeon]|nr:hypothetical protein [Nitrososphaerota archaeon]
MSRRLNLGRHMGIVKMHQDHPELSVNDLAAEWGTSRKQIQRVLRRWEGVEFSQIPKSRDADLWPMGLVLYRHGYLAAEVGEFVRYVGGSVKAPTIATVMRRLRYEAGFDGKGALEAHEKRHRDRLNAYWPSVKDLRGNYARWRRWRGETGGRIDFEEVLRLHPPPNGV